MFANHQKVKVDENRLTIRRQGINDIYKHHIIINGTLKIQKINKNKKKMYITFF